MEINVLYKFKRLTEETQKRVEKDFLPFLIKKEIEVLLNCEFPPVAREILNAFDIDEDIKDNFNFDCINKKIEIIKIEEWDLKDFFIYNLKDLVKNNKYIPKGKTFETKKEVYNFIFEELSRQATEKAEEIKKGIDTYKLLDRYLYDFKGNPFVIL